MATHSSILAWKIPWTEEPGRLQYMGLLRVGHDWVTSLSLFLSCIGEGNGNPLQCSCLENPRDKGAWWAAIYGVAQSRTRLKWLSSSSSSILLYERRSTNTESYTFKFQEANSCIFFNLRIFWNTYWGWNFSLGMRPNEKPNANPDSSLSSQVSVTFSSKKHDFRKLWLRFLAKINATCLP